MITAGKNVGQWWSLDHSPSDEEQKLYLRRFRRNVRRRWIMQGEPKLYIGKPVPDDPYYQDWTIGYKVGVLQR